MGTSNDSNATKAKDLDGNGSSQSNSNVRANPNRDTDSQTTVHNRGSDEPSDTASAIAVVGRLQDALTGIVLQLTEIADILAAQPSARLSPSSAAPTETLSGVSSSTSDQRQDTPSWQ